MSSINEKDLTKVSGGIDLNKSKKFKRPIGPLDRECECKSCKTKFVDYHYNGAIPCDPFSYDYFRFLHHGEYCSKCMREKYESEGPYCKNLNKELN